MIGRSNILPAAKIPISNKAISVVGSTIFWNITPITPTVTINSNTSLTVNNVITGLDKTVTAVEYWGSTDNVTFSKLTKAGATTSYQHDGLENNSIHYYKVRYWSGISVSGFSGVVMSITFDADNYLVGRSGLSLTALTGNNASILPVCGKTNGTDSYVTAPIATKTWTFTEFTCEILFKSPATLPTTNKAIMGRNASGDANGDLDMVYKYTSPNVFLLFQNRTSLSQSAAIAANTLYHVIVTGDSTNGQRMFINGSLVDSDAFTEVLASATEPYSLGAYLTGTTPSGFIENEVYTVRVYNVSLNDTELAQRFAKTDVTRGLILAWDFMEGNESGVVVDRSGQGNHGTWYGTAPYYTYSANGSQDNLNNGYKRYFKLGYFPIYLPKLIGSENYPTGMSFPSGFAEQQEISGSATKHNLAGSKIRFADLPVYDRSNTTTNNAFSRASAYYDAANVRDWHIWEAANYNIIASYLNTGYQAMMFPKNSWAVGLDVINRPISLEALILTDENLSGEGLNNMLEYTGNE